MATIEEMQSKMTVFYSKQSGKIIAIYGGIEDMSVFMDNEEDFSIIYNFFITDKDDFVIENKDKFMVVDGDLKLKEEYKPVNLDKYL